MLEKYLAVEGHEKYRITDLDRVLGWKREIMEIVVDTGDNSVEDAVLNSFTLT